MSSNEDYNYKHQRVKEASTARKIIFIVLLLITITIVIGTYKTYSYIDEGLSPVDPNDKSIIEVTIPMGSSIEKIGQVLEEENVINDSFIFKYYVKFKNETGFQAGDYKLSKSMTLDKIIESLKTGKILVEPLFTVTIPEGSNIEQIAGILSQNTSIKKETFLEKMTNQEYIKSLIGLYPDLLTDEILSEGIRYPLEGYLYAATYPFYEEDPTVEQVIEMMLQETRERISPFMQELINSDEMNVHDLVTLASLIEEEAVTEEDRKMISGVFHNRLEAGMKLETDPTVLYALGEHKDRVLYEHLEIESPYNTYYIEGLPIGPIANFHENALEAALYPEDHSYLFFVAGYDGEVYYAEDYNQHQENINKYRPPQEQ